MWHRGCGAAGLLGNHLGPKIFLTLTHSCLLRILLLLETKNVLALQLFGLRGCRASKGSQSHSHLFEE